MTYVSAVKLLMVLWMAKYGVGLVPPKDMVASARRVRVR